MDPGKINLSNTTTSYSAGQTSKASFISGKETFITDKVSISGYKEPIILNGTKKNNFVKISQTEAGNLVVNVNNKEKTYTKEEAGRLIIDLGKGNNSLIAGESVTYGLNIRAGDGNNYIQGGTGDDMIIAGNGNNVIYGLDGKDKVTVGNGNNYIDGGDGDDFIIAGSGKNILIGGKGSDIINSASGKNTIIGDINVSLSKETIKTAQIHKYNSDDPGISKLGKNIEIIGDNNFKKRVESDLETLRAIPAGQKMLEELEKTGKFIRIEVLPLEDKNGYALPDEWDKCNLNLDGTRNEGSGSTIRYNPSFTLENKTSVAAPPLVVLFHEMAHAYNQATGTMIPNNLETEVTGNCKLDYERACEYQAIGLPINNALTDYITYEPNDTYIPSPTHPDGTVSLGNPDGLSENALRKELGLEPRNSYG